MKKLVLFSLIAALVAGAAFAEVTVGGEVKGAWSVLQGSNLEDHSGTDSVVVGGALNDDLKNESPWTGGAFSPSVTRARVAVTAVNEDETLGAWFRIQAAFSSDFASLANVWWQPIEQFKATIGYFWGGSNMIGDVVNVDDNILPVQFYGRYGHSSGVFHAWGWEPENAASLELKPIENLYIAVSVPFDQKFTLGKGYVDTNDDGTADKNEDASALDVFAQTAARIAYTITDIGEVVLTWDGGTMTVVDMPTFNPLSASLADLADAIDPAYIGLHFNLLAVENLAASVGFDLPLPISKVHRNVQKPSDFKDDFTVQMPIAVNLRASYSADALFIGAGIKATFGGALEVDDAVGTLLGVGAKFKYTEGFGLGVTVNPAYDIGIVKIGLVGELQLNAGSKVESGSTDATTDLMKESKVSFNVIPYVRKDLAGGSVYAGFQIAGKPYLNKEKDGYDSEMAWSIPIGFIYSF